MGAGRWQERASWVRWAGWAGAGGGAPSSRTRTCSEGPPGGRRVGGLGSEVAAEGAHLGPATLGDTWHLRWGHWQPTWAFGQIREAGQHPGRGPGPRGTGWGGGRAGEAHLCSSGSEPAWGPRASSLGSPCPAVLTELRARWPEQTAGLGSGDCLGLVSGGAGGSVWASRACPHQGRAGGLEGGQRGARRGAGEKPQGPSQLEAGEPMEERGAHESGLSRGVCPGARYLPAAPQVRAPEDLEPPHLQPPARSPLVFCL